MIRTPLESTQASALLRTRAETPSELDRLLAAREQTRQALRRDFLRMEALMAELTGLLATRDLPTAPAAPGDGQPREGHWHAPWRWRRR